MSDKTILHITIGGPIAMQLKSAPYANPLTTDDLAPYEDDDDAILYCENCDIRTSISILRAWVELGTMDPAA